MKTPLLILLFGFFASPAFSQNNVGIGTSSPHPKAILDLSSTNKVFLMPRMDTTQMKAIGTVPYGSIIYNSSLKTHMAYIPLGFKYSNIIIGSGRTIVDNAKWLPVSAGPKILAWGFIDSTGGGHENTVTSKPANIIAGSGNFTVTFQGGGVSKKWYELNLINDKFEKDSMLLMVTPVGNGSWDVAVSIGEVLTSNDAVASIKFTDISRTVAGFSDMERRRRSFFYFVLYDLRRY